MDFYQEMTIEVRADGVTSFSWRNPEGPYYGRSFYTKTTEWLQFLRPFSKHNQVDVLRDGYHLLTRMMEMWTFIDSDGVNLRIQGEGKSELRICNMRVPYKVAEKLVEHIETAVKSLERSGEERISITLDREVRAEWLAKYGIGKGKAKFEYQNDEQKARFEKELAKYADRDDEEAKSFQRCVERLTNMAKNTTQTVEEEGIVRIGYDWAGFTFSAGGMYGGFIHHGADENDDGGDWSLHT